MNNICSSFCSFPPDGAEDAFPDINQDSHIPDINTFKPGGIHAPQVRDFWKNTLKANSWVMDLIDYGYTLPLIEKPTSSFLKNNLSARKNMGFVREEIMKLEASGVVVFTSTKPTIVSPLTVASNSSGKLRLCLDVSRSVNKFLSIPKVVLADLSSALEITETNDWQAVYDLSSAYFHIKVLEEHTQYLGAAFEREDGTIQYFIYKFLPFGISSAVHVMTKVMKPFCAFIFSQGIKHTIYLDDGRVCSPSRLQAAADFSKVLDFLKRAGWTVALNKSDTPDTVSQVKHYLGFKIDSSKMKVFLQDQKQVDLTTLVSDLIKKKGQLVKVKFLAKVLGKMISCAPALGKIPLIFARQGYFLLEDTVERKGWGALVRISAQVTDSLETFLSTFPLYNGHPIAHSCNTISVLSLIGPPDEHFTNSFVPQHLPTLPKDVFASDASNFAVCSYSIHSKEPFFFIGQLSHEHTKVSSGHRELLAVYMALKAKLEAGSIWQDLTNIFWLTDSQNMVSFLNKGSTKPEIQTTVLDIMALTVALNIRLIPLHLRREDPRIQMADAGSRVRDSDDWSLDDFACHQLSKTFGPFSLDPFADSSNAKTERFFSDFLCPNTSGINAFAHSWDNEHVWLCPPVSKIIPTLRKIVSSNLTGVLIVPAWETANFWPLLFPQNKKPFYINSVQKIYPTIIQNQRALSPLSGKTPFGFLVLSINTCKSL